MTNLAIEELLLRERTGQISSETGGGSGVVEYAYDRESALRRIGDVLPGRASGQPAETFRPIASKTAEICASSGSIRGRDLLLIGLSAYLGSAMPYFLLGFVAGFYAAMRYGTDSDVLIDAAVQNFYFAEIVTASFYFAALLAMRRRLRKRRGRGSFASYFRPIGLRHLVYAILSGLLLFGLTWLVRYALRSLAHPQYHPTATGIIVQLHSLGRLAVFGFICVVLAPLTEEMFFRGLLLEWLQQRLGHWAAASISAAIFALGHLRFVGHPGIGGWIITALISIGGLVNALWAQRTHSLRAPIAVHATHNAAVVLLFSW